MTVAKTINCPLNQRKSSKYWTPDCDRCLLAKIYMARKATGTGYTKCFLFILILSHALQFTKDTGYSY